MNRVDRYAHLGVPRVSRRDTHRRTRRGVRILMALCAFAQTARANSFVDGVRHHLTVPSAITPGLDADASRGAFIELTNEKRETTGKTGPTSATVPKRKAPATGTSGKRASLVAKARSVAPKATSAAAAHRAARPAKSQATPVAPRNPASVTVVATGTVLQFVGDERSAMHDSAAVEPVQRVLSEARSVQVISVPRPRRLDTASVVHFRVLSSGATPLLGQREGQLTSADAQVLFTVSVPASSRAGRLPIATVRFTTSSGDVVDAPIELLVRAQRQITLTPLATLISVVQGGRTSVRIRLDNEGNATDTIQLRTLLPKLWRTRMTSSERVVIGAGQTIERVVEIQAPPGGSTGAVPVSWQLLGLTTDTDSLHRERARVESMLELVSATHGNNIGPQVGLSMSSISAPALPTATVFAVQLTGPVTNGTQIDARWSQQTAYGTPGLARVGAYASLPYISLFAPNWRVDLGNAGVMLSELTGLNTQGRGLSGAVRTPRWNVDAIAAVPQFGMGSSVRHGTLAAAKLAADFDGTIWSATASHLRDGRTQAGQLDALAVGAARKFDGGTDVRAEVAGRKYFDGSGLGMLAELSHRSSSGEWRLRASRAPGGADAFALAQSDVTATGAQRFGVLRLGTLGWYSDDAGVGGRFQRARGISLLPQFRLGRHGSIGGEVRVTESSGGDSLSQFGSSARGVSAFASEQAGPVSLSTTATLTRNARDARLVVGDPFLTRETQLMWTSQAVLPTRLGVIDLFSGLQRAYGENVFFAGQHELQVRLDNVSVPWLSTRARVGAALGRVAALDGSSTYITRRFSLSAILPFDAVLRVDAERNPMFSLGGVRGGWTTVFRIERSFGAPPLLPGMRAGGVVFEDANGNGVRDSGERGIAGVVVRAAGEVAVTDRAGMYRFSSRQVGEVQLDERSLPFGLMLAPRQDAPTLAGSPGSMMRDLAVQPVGVINVQLTLVDETYASGAPPSLAPVSVVAVDRAGRRFLARHEDDGRTVFDALPPGEYQVEVDASGTSEPLTVRSDLPEFTVSALRPAVTVKVVLGPRRLRLFHGTPASTTLKNESPAVQPDSSKNAGKSPSATRSKTSPSGASRSKSR